MYIKCCSLEGKVSLFLISAIAGKCVMEDPALYQPLVVIITTH